MYLSDGNIFVTKRAGKLRVSTTAPRP